MLRVFNRKINARRHIEIASRILVCISQTKHCMQTLDRCQSELHKWGKANQVSFDPAKESQHILALTGGEGMNFKLLGIPFDNALTMRDAVVELVSEASWKLASILRSGRFFTDGELVTLYKSQLLSYLEYRTAAIYHACNTVLAPLDSFQDRFL